MYTEEMLAELAQLEETIRFTSFTLNDAYALGSQLHEASLSEEKPIAIRIILGDLLAYQALSSGNTAINCQWLDKKQRTVAQCHHSSLYAAAERELHGANYFWQDDEERYAFCGGAFPIIVNDEYAGTVIVSGLPHLEDHRFLIDVLTKFHQAMNK